MNSLIKFFACLLVISQLMIAIRAASSVVKFDTPKSNSLTLDEDAIKSPLQQVPRYIAYLHRDGAGPYYKRAGTGIDTLTGFSIGKRSNPSTNMYTQRRSTFESNLTPEIATEYVYSINNQQQQKALPREYQLFKLNGADQLDALNWNLI